MSSQRPPAGFRLRSATNADLDTCAAVVKAAAEADRVTQVESRDSVAHDLEHAGHLGNAVLGVAERDGRIVGFHRLGWFEQPDGLEVYTHRGHVLPQARGLGVGTALVTRAEQQLIILASRRATLNPKTLSGWYYDGEVGAASLLATRGYERHRVMSEMQHDLKDILEHPLPQGLEVRPFQPEQLRAIWKAYVAFSADEVSSVVDSEAAFHAWRSLPQWNHRLWLVAWDGGDIVGITLSHYVDENKSGAYTEFVGIARSWRRRGAGRALLALTLQELQLNGAVLASLDVHDQNPSNAHSTYEALGYRGFRRLVVVRRRLRA